MFLIDITLNKCVLKLLILIIYNSQEMCDKAVDDNTNALQLVPD